MQNIPPTHSQERGATLIVGLIMVVLITVIGLAAIRGSGLQEQMAGNMRDRHLAFDAAEAALREGEKPLAEGTAPIGKKTGFYKSLDHPDSGYWLGRGANPFDWATKSAKLSEKLKGVSEKPRYVVEKLSFVPAGKFGNATDWASVLESEQQVMYRVTSRGVGGSDKTVVLLQSTFN